MSNASDPSGHAAARERLRACLLLVGLVVGAASVLYVATPATWHAATAPGADAGALLAGLALAAAWTAAARLAATVVAVILAALPGGCGRIASRVAATLSPGLLRGVVRAALGLAVAGGPLLTGTAAMAAGPAYPILDRVVAAPAPASTAVQAAPPTKAATGSSRPRDRGATRGNVVAVRPGDTLWGIAARSLPARHSDTDIARAWPRWYAENRAVVGPDPGHLRPGEHLEAPHS